MISRTHVVWMLVLALGDLGMCIGVNRALPPRVPVHWNLRGEVDRYGSAAELTIVLPLILAFCVLLPLLATLSIAAQSSGLQKSRMALGRMMVAIAAVFVGLHAAILWAASGKPIDLLAVVFVFVGLLWLVIGNSMGKIRRNAIMGVRTPWTLKSDMIWERTNRLGGQLMVAHGVAILLAALLLPAWMAIVVFGVGTIGLVVWAMVYSWRLDRESHGGKVCV
jgi:uncharacterized membrane protein